MEDNQKQIDALFEESKKIEVYRDLLISRECYENGEYEEFDDAIGDISEKYGLDDETIDFGLTQRMIDKYLFAGNIKELHEKLRKIPNSYPAFVGGVIRYATTSKDRKEKVIAYLDENPNAICSQITEFVMKQPDFHDAARQTLLEHKLYEIIDAYSEFITAVLNYVTRKLGRVDVVLKYLEDNKEATTSDVLSFISNQGDFYEDGE